MNNIKNINYPKQLIFKGDLTLLVSIASYSEQNRRKGSP